MPSSPELWSSTESSSVCQFCQTKVCEENHLWGYHHESLLGLEQSAGYNCIFCVRVLQTIKLHFRDRTPTIWPLYRWNARRLAQTRDMQEIVSIMFRPVDVCKTEESEGLETPLKELTFHCYRVNEVKHVLPGPSLGPSTNSKETWNQVETWVDQCTNHHPMCHRESDESSPLPTRLLDISAVNPDGKFQGNLLVVNTKMKKVKGPYVTLSHSWGKNPTFITVQAENEKEMMETGFPFDHEGLTKNFREAILVARHLHINYIWIDSICILQKQKNAEDFLREAPLMHQYYRYAYCNIAASDAHVPTDGLFRSRGNLEKCYPTTVAKLIPKSVDGHLKNHSWLIVATDTWESQLLRNVLYTRAWVFQERMLARRVLHFSRSQVFFECATISACETLPEGIPRASGLRAATDRYWRQRLHSGLSLRQRPVSGTSDLSIEEFWRTSVNTYTRCELTERSDKLIAFQGVAKLVKDTLEDEVYSNGLWSKRLEEQLAWRVDHCRQANGESSIRMLPLRFPSWSWASMSGIIEVRDRLPPTPRHYCVRSHDGGPVKFEVEDHDDTISVPKVLQGAVTPSLDGDCASKQHKSRPEVNGKTKPDHIISAAPVPVTQDLKAIKICGYIRHGYLQREGTECRLHSDSCGKIRCDIAPDEPLREDQLPCSYMVLAYSRIEDTQNSRHNSYLSPKETKQQDKEGTKAADIEGSKKTNLEASSVTFSGIGLVLGRSDSNLWYRIGAFEFRFLAGSELSALTVVQDEGWNQEDIIKDERSQIIYLC